MMGFRREDFEPHIAMAPAQRANVQDDKLWQYLGILDAIDC